MEDLDSFDLGPFVDFLEEGVLLLGNFTVQLGVFALWHAALGPCIYALSITLLCYHTAVCDMTRTAAAHKQCMLLCDMCES